MSKNAVSQNKGGAPLKEHRISTQLQFLLDRQLPVDHAEYRAGLTLAEILAEKLAMSAVETKDPKVMLDYLKEIADRTEGKAKQSTDVTSNGETVTVSVFIPEKYEEPAE